jgi:hypothetical protein
MIIIPLIGSILGAMHDNRDINASWLLQQHGGSIGWLEGV